MSKVSNLKAPSDSALGQVGGTRRVGDLPGGPPCPSPEHDPPAHMVYRPGVYEHVCPRCGRKTTFTVKATM